MRELKVWPHSRNKLCVPPVLLIYGIARKNLKKTAAARITSPSLHISWECSQSPALPNHRLRIFESRRSISRYSHTRVTSRAIPQYHSM